MQGERGTHEDTTLGASPVVAGTAATSDVTWLGVTNQGHTRKTTGQTGLGLQPGETAATGEGLGGETLALWWRGGGIGDRCSC